MADGHKAIVAILILCGGAGLVGYNFAPRANSSVEVATPIKQHQERPTERRPLPVFDSDQWSQQNSTDQMTGKKEMKLSLRQDNGSGAYAETEAACETIGKGHAVTFTTLIVDANGDPTIGIANRASPSDGQFVRIRYRQNDVTKLSRVPNRKFSNEFITFSAIDDEAADFYKNSPLGINLYLAGLEGLLFMAHYSNVQLVKAEYQTDHGPLIVTIDTTAPSIKRLYHSCFDKN